MRNRLPNLIQRKKICIICEGNEEYDYLLTLKDLKVWNEIFDIHLINAKGNGNIPARYQDSYQNDSYDIVFVFCDTDKKPYEQYGDIKRKINQFHGIDVAAKNVVIFGNPCTMQIILQHFANVNLTTSAKKVNATIIEECTGVKSYKGKEEHRFKIMKNITRTNYHDMYQRVKGMNQNDVVCGSSNFVVLLDYLSCSHSKWIISINKILEN